MRYFQFKDGTGLFLIKTKKKSKYFTYLLYWEIFCHFCFTNKIFYIFLSTINIICKMKQTHYYLNYLSNIIS